MAIFRRSGLLALLCFLLTGTVLGQRIFDICPSLSCPRGTVDKGKAIAVAQGSGAGHASGQGLSCPSCPAKKTGTPMGPQCPSPADPCEKGSGCCLQPAESAAAGLSETFSSQSWKIVLAYPPLLRVLDRSERESAFAPSPPAPLAESLPVYLAFRRLLI